VVTIAAKNLLARVTLILKKTLNTATNNLALPKNWGTEQQRDVLLKILEMLTTVWMISKKL